MGRSIMIIREEMLALADRVEAGTVGRQSTARELRQLAEDTYRNRSGKRAAPTAKAMTPMLGAEVRAYAKLNPEMSNRKIGRHFGIDGGRVSEALSGRYFDRFVEVAFHAGAC